MKDSVIIPDKRDCECCRGKVDELGRFPIGFCGPDCERRKARDRWIVASRRAHERDRWYAKLA